MAGTDALIVYSCSDCVLRGRSSSPEYAVKVLVTSLGFEIVLTDRAGDPVIDSVLDFSKAAVTRMGFMHVAQLRHYWEGSTLSFWGTLARSYEVDSEHGMVMHKTDHMLPEGIKFMPVYNSKSEAAVVLLDQVGVSKQFGAESWSIQWIMASAAPFDVEAVVRRSQFGPKLLVHLPSRCLEDRIYGHLEIEERTMTDDNAPPHVKSTGDSAAVGCLLSYYANQLVYDATSDSVLVTSIERDKLQFYTDHHIPAANGAAIARRDKSQTELAYRRQTLQAMQDAGEGDNASAELQALGAAALNNSDPSSSSSSSSSKRGGKATLAWSRSRPAVQPTREGDSSSSSSSGGGGGNINSDVDGKEGGEGEEGATHPSPYGPGTPQPHAVRSALSQPPGPGRSKLALDLVTRFLLAPRSGLAHALAATCSPHDMLVLARDCCELVHIENRKVSLAIKGSVVQCVYLVVDGSVEEDHGRRFIRKQPGQLIGEEVLKGAREWPFDAETSHVRPRLDRGLVDAAFKGAVPKQALQTHIHNNVCLCRIDVRALLRYVGRPSHTTTEASSYLHCLWRYLKADEYVDKTRKGMALPVFPTPLVSEEGDGTGVGLGFADPGLTVKRLVADQIIKQQRQEQQEQQQEQEQGRSAGQYESRSWATFRAMEAEEADLLRDLRHDRDQILAPLSLPSVAAAQATTDSVVTSERAHPEKWGREEAEERKRRRRKKDGGSVAEFGGGYYGPFGSSFAFEEDGPNSHHTGAGGATHATGFDVLLSEPVPAAELASGAVRELQAGDVILEQGQARAHLVLVTRGEVAVLRRVAGECVPVSSPAVSGSHDNDNNNNNNIIKTREEQPQQPQEGAVVKEEGKELDTGLRLLAGDFVFMDGESVQWVQEQQKLMHMRVHPNGYDRVDRYTIKPLFGTHRHSFVALVSCEIVVIPLNRVARSVGLFTHLLRLTSRKYPVLGTSDTVLGLRYLQSTVQRKERSWLARGLAATAAAAAAAAAAQATGGSTSKGGRTVFRTGTGNSSQKQQQKHMKRGGDRSSSSTNPNPKPKETDAEALCEHRYQMRSLHRALTLLDQKVSARSRATIRARKESKSPNKHRNGSSVGSDSNGGGGKGVPQAVVGTVRGEGGSTAAAADDDNAREEGEGKEGGYESTSSSESGGESDYYAQKYSQHNTAAAAPVEATMPSGGHSHHPAIAGSDLFTGEFKRRLEEAGGNIQLNVQSIGLSGGSSSSGGRGSNYPPGGGGGGAGKELAQQCRPTNMGAGGGANSRNSGRSGGVSIVAFSEMATRVFESSGGGGGGTTPGEPTGPAPSSGGGAAFRRRLSMV